MGIINMRRRIASLITGLCLTALPAAAEQTLRVGVGGAFTSIDPHYFNLNPNNVLTEYVFDRLIRS